MDNTESKQMEGNIKEGFKKVFNNEGFKNEKTFKEGKKSIINNVLKILCAKKLLGKDYFDLSNIWSWGRGQYKGCVYWVCLKLTDNICGELNKDYKDVKAIHIKPYRITSGDVECALSNEQQEFCDKIDKIKKDTKFVDYDPTTANFHKRTSEIQFQIVLVQGGGPGWGIDGKKYGNEILLKDNKVVKTNWYFPSIGETNETKLNKSLSQLLEDVLNAIFKGNNTTKE